MEEPSSSQCEEPDTVRAVTQSVKQLTTPAAAGDLPKVSELAVRMVTYSRGLLACPALCLSSACKGAQQLRSRGSRVHAYTALALHNK